MVLHGFQAQSQNVGLSYCAVTEAKKGNSIYYFDISRHKQIDRALKGCVR